MKYNVEVELATGCHHQNGNGDYYGSWPGSWPITSFVNLSAYVLKTGPANYSQRIGYGIVGFQWLNHVFIYLTNVSDLHT